jgi:hypothetical protein
MGRAEVFRQRPDIATGYGGLDWTLGVADLRNVLSFQKTVVVQDAGTRTANVDQSDWDALFSICLPETPAQSNLLQLLTMIGRHFRSRQKILTSASCNSALIQLEAKSSMGFRLGSFLHMFRS